jgi:redox-sensitive bicupin YhaK (pirin superfamily)
MPLESYPAHPTRLGPLQIWRALPRRAHRLIGAWCFLDRYGPLSFTDDKPMDVAPHPHIGIKTVSWLLEGEVLHRDSLGFEAMARPGAVNIMSSGRGIAHAEETPASNIGRLNGVQLWVAQTEEERHAAPSFRHVAEVPQREARGGFSDVFYDEPGIGADVRVHAGSTLELPLAPAFEHGLFLLDGDATIEGEALEVNTLYYFGVGQAALPVRSVAGARFLLLGGEPFPEPVLMWWNFVARTSEEIAAARAAWEEGSRFGEVRGYAGPRLHAPELTRLAPPNPAS